MTDGVEEISVARVNNERVIPLTPAILASKFGVS